MVMVCTAVTGWSEEDDDAVEGAVDVDEVVAVLAPLVSADGVEVDDLAMVASALPVKSSSILQ